MNNSFLRHFRSSLHTRIRYSTTAIPIIVPTTTAIATTASTTTFSQSLSSSSSSTTTDTNNKPEKLSEEAVKASLRLLSYQGTPFPWVEAKEGNAITKSFHFTDFNQAWSFMSRTALLAERMDHHPDWSNVYNQVEVTLSTHDCDGVSIKDINMARAMETYASDLMPEGSKSYFSPTNSNTD